MNERFLELAEQLPGWVSTDDGAYIGPHSSALKLYAELIVRECMAVSSKAMTDGYWPPHMISKHFGIDP
jgi:hypothetical protein